MQKNLNYRRFCRNIILNYMNNYIDYECNENGYGDYFNMTIQPDGTINNWSENMESKINDFLEKYEIYG